jgi:uncharacterized OB-fold protein
MPPEEVCPHCGSTEPAFTFEPVDGGGVVRSWTVVRQSFLPGFDVPFVLVDVELDDAPDVRLIGRLLGCQVDGPDLPVHLDDHVVVAFEDLGPGVSVPAFVTEASGQAAAGRGGR